MTRNAQVDNLVVQMKDRIDRNRAEQAKEKDNQLALQPRREIVDAPAIQYQPFWCHCCAKDYNAIGRKVVEGQGQTASAVYLSECPDGHTNYRYITDIPHDPYWMRSQAVARDRALHADDLLSPHDYEFRHKYPEQWRQYEHRRELAEQGG